MSVPSAVGKHLFIVNDFPPIRGGQSAFLCHLCRALPAEKIVVLAPACGDTRAFDGAQEFPIVRRPYLVPVPILEKAVKIILPFFWAGSIMRREPVACLHCAHVLSTGFIGWAYRKLQKLDYVVYCHSADILEHAGNPWLRPWLDRILRGASYVVANSRFTAGKLQGFGVAAEKVLVSWPKIDCQEFGGIDPQPVLERHGIRGRRIVLSVGRLIERKGFDRMISAWPAIRQAFPDAVYVVFGHGPYEPALRRMAAAADVGDSVRFIAGDDAEKKALLAACELLVMVSREIKARGDAEGFGVVYLEAAACGKPVVAGDSGGVRDAVRDGETGLLVDPEDPAAVAAAVKKLLADPLLAERLGAQGRVRVLAGFDYRRGATELDPVFKGQGHGRE